jgi:hypothetical protein
MPAGQMLNSPNAMELAASGASSCGAQRLDADNSASGEADRDADVQRFPVLQQLGLLSAELVALREQGYLTQDDRGHGHAGYWRLRFRFDGRMRTIYLGRDVELLDRVREELGLLREPRRIRRQLVDVARQTRQALRAAKQRLAGPLRQIGMRFHGDCIRKCRRKQLLGE